MAELDRGMRFAATSLPSVTSLDVFDTTVHKTNIWLNDLLRALGWQERQKAYLALRVTLQALRDRLTVEEVAQLGQQFSGDDRIDPEQVARAVFTALAKRVSEGEIEDVKHVLPAEIRDLWP
jgi:uncharacterized protein (DUF2267 family)